MPGGKRMYRYKSKSASKTKDDKQDKEIRALRRRLPKLEKRYALSELSALALNTSWSFSILNNVIQGGTAQSREGNECNFFRLEMSGLIQTAAVVGGSAVCRMLVVQDRQANGATFAATDLFYDQTDIWSLFNVPLMHRFSVLFDKTIDLNSYAANSSNITYRSFKKNKKIKVKTSYNGNVGTIADIEKNSIYFIYASNIAAGTDDPRGDFHIRLWFTE